MMRLLGRLIDLAEAALAAGAQPEDIGAIACMRKLQRMGEEIADDQLPTLTELQARMEREIAQLTQQPGPEARDAAHG
jgi:V/A-type H+/Na+-transporting ATPase subunit A